MWQRIALAMVVLSVAGFCSAQSLGDVARKEKQRREKNKTEGVEVHEFAETDIATDEGEAVEDEKTDSPQDPVTEAEPPANRGVDRDSDDDGGTERLDRDRQNRVREEAEWRARVAQARSRVKQARERKEALSGLFLAQGERYVDAQGHTVVRSLEDLRRLVQEADEELAGAEQSLADLLNEARHAGVPPGWVR